MTVETAPHPSMMTGRETALHPSMMTGRAAQWVGLMMLLEVFGLIALICLG